MNNTPTTDLVKSILDEYMTSLLDKVYDKVYEKAQDYEWKNGTWCYSRGTDEYNTLKALKDVAERKYNTFKEMMNETKDELSVRLWEIEMDEMNKC